MELRLDLRFRPFEHREQQVDLARRMWGVLERVGTLAPTTHVATGHANRGRKKSGAGDPFAGSHESVAALSGPDRYAADLRISVDYRYDVELTVVWGRPAANLYERIETIAIELDAAIGGDGWFFFSGLSSYGIEPVLLGPSRWHRWMKGSIVWDAWDTRLPDAVDVILGLDLGEGASVRREGRWQFIRWTESLDERELASAMGRRERLLASTFHWPLENHGDVNAGSERFPRATNSTRLGPPGELPQAVADLVKAVRRKHHKKAARLLEGLDPTEIGEALGPVCGEGDLDMANALIEEGADPCFAGVAGWTPLMWATHERRVEVVRWLIERGATVDAVSTREEVTALHIAAGDRVAEWEIRRKRSVDARALEEVRARATTIGELLIEAGGPLDVPSRNGVTAFHTAAASGRFELCLALLRAGASPYERDAEGASAFELLAVRGSIAELARMTALVDEVRAP